MLVGGKCAPCRGGVKAENLKAFFEKKIRTNFRNTQGER